MLDEIYTRKSKCYLRYVLNRHYIGQVTIIVIVFIVIIIIIIAVILV
jgi:hypothetical protein